LHNLFRSTLLEHSIPDSELARLGFNSIMQLLMRSIERTRATSAAWSAGLVRYSSAPALSPMKTSRESVRAVLEDERAAILNAALAVRGTKRENPKTTATKRWCRGFALAQGRELSR
jgi:hypothetical protein